MAYDDRLQDMIENLLHCNICFKPFTNPKLLSCMHTFCSPCLQHWYKSSQEIRGAKRGIFPCPTCREMTPLPAEGIEGLTTDFKVPYIDKIIKTRMPRAQNDKSCEVCKSRGREVKGKAECMTCHILLCGPCGDSHPRDNEIFRDHIVLELVSGEKSARMFCEKHDQKDIKYFCISCQKGLCALCAESEHKKHRLENMEKSLVRARNELESEVKSADVELERAQQAAQKFTVMDKYLEQSFQENRDAVKRRAKEMIQKIKHQQNELLDELEFRYKNITQSYEENKNVVYHTLAKYKSLKSYMSNLLASDNPTNIMVSTGTLKGKLQFKNIGVPEVPQIKKDIRFIPGSKDDKFGYLEERSVARIPLEGAYRGDSVTATGAKTLLNIPSEDKGMQSQTKITVKVNPKPRQPTTLLGKSRKKKAAPSPPEVTTLDLSSSSPSTSLPSSPPGVPKLILSLTKSGNLPGELNWTSDCTFLPDGNFMVADRNNARLQIFDRHGKVQKVLGQGLVMPWAVAMTKAGHIAVSDDRDQCIKLFSTSDSHLTTKIGNFVVPSGLAINSQGHYIVSDIGAHCISIYQASGENIREFGHYGTGVDQFDCPYYLAINSKDHIIVSDSNNHCLKVFNRRGWFLMKIGGAGSGDGQLKCPEGVCVDREDNIIVADRDNGRISMFSSEGRFMRHLLTPNMVSKPYGVAVSLTNQLLVTEAHTVQLFQL